MKLHKTPRTIAWCPHTLSVLRLICPSLYSLYISITLSRYTNDMMDCRADNHTEQCDPGMNCGSFAAVYRIDVMQNTPRHNSDREQLVAFLDLQRHGLCLKLLTHSLHYSYVEDYTVCQLTNSKTKFLDIIRSFLSSGQHNSPFSSVSVSLNGYNLVSDCQLQHNINCRLHCGIIWVQYVSPSRHWKYNTR